VQLEERKRSDKRSTFVTRQHNQEDHQTMLLIKNSQEVNTHLDELEDSHNIDMSLITDASSRRPLHHASPGLSSRISHTISTRSSMNSEGAHAVLPVLSIALQEPPAVPSRPASRRPIFAVDKRL